MDKLLTIRAKIKQYYTLWDIYIIPAVKFLTAFAIFMTFSGMVAYRTVLNRVPMMLLIALVCCLLPWEGITIVSCLYVVLQLSALSWEVASEAVAFFVLMMIIHYLFLPGHSIIIVLVPLAYALKIPYAVPLIVGIVGGLTTFIPVGLGVFLYYFLQCVQRNTNIFAETGGKTEILTRFTVVLDALRGNKLMMLSILAFCIVTIVVYMVHKLSLDYSHLISITAGGVVNMLIFLLGGFVMNISVPYIGVILGTLFSMAVVVAVQFYILAVDYSRTEFLEYEDDDYIYYVKAVPKINLAEQHRKVQEINARQNDSEDADKSEIESALNVLEHLDMEAAEDAKNAEKKELEARIMTGPIEKDDSTGE